MLKGNRDIGLYNRDLPEGCRLCRLGQKLVVFITGQCTDSCSYCPVSEERANKPIMYANEKPVNEVEEIISEAYRMGATGASITGGDPLLVMDRTEEIIRRLKDEFGRKFHIHLYTSGRYLTRDAIEVLRDAGLDEIRLHPVKVEYLEFIKRAQSAGIEVVVEIPSLFFDRQLVEEVIKWAVQNGVKFVNLNELEITERNFRNMLSRGVKVDHGIAGVSKSSEFAIEVLQKYEEFDTNLHYCSSVYKDVVETRTRFIRTGMKWGKPYEEVTGEGTIKKIVTVGKTENLSRLMEFGEVNQEGGEFWIGTLETVREMIREGLLEKAWIVEEHPDFRRLRVNQEEIRPTDRLRPQKGLSSQ